MRKRNIVIVSIALLVLTAYALSVNTLVTTNYATTLGVEIHVDMYHYRNGILLAHSHHAGVLTNLGANWTKNQMGDTPDTDPAKWIAVSNDAGAPSATWVVIPNEITTGGMGRAAGTYVDDGVGQWNITKTFSPTGTGSCQLTGLYWALAGDFLLCADTFTQVNYENGDTVQIRWSLSVTGS